MIERFLHNYENSSMIIKLKVRFLLYLLLLVIILTPPVILYSSYSQITDPSINNTVKLLVVMPQALLFFLMIGTLVLLFRGHFVLSAHLTAILVFATIWAVIYLEQTEIIKRLDTTLLLLGFLSAAPIFISKKKYMALVYGAANLLLLYVYIFYFRDMLGLSDSTIAEYLSDNTVSFLFSAIVSYNILSINNRALDQVETSNAALQHANMELKVAMEELTASNEEYESQNEELLKSEEALRSSETDLLAVFNSVHDAMIVFDLDGVILDVNTRMLEMFRLKRREALSLKITDLSATPIDMDSVKQLWVAVINGKDALFEWEIKRPGDKSTVFTEVGLKPLNRRGKPALLAVVRDITLRKLAEQALKESLAEKISLIKEIHHRVKNNMQVISSLLNMQADSVEETIAGRALKDAVGRIHSMASIHEKIYRTENFSKVDMSSYIEELSGDLVTLYSGGYGNIRINHSMNPVFLGIDLAVPCGLLINELLTNSIKHGSGETGVCIIDLGLEESDGMITLIVADHGPGMKTELFESQRKTSMGMQIIEALARQIDAKITLSVEDGTRFTVRFPSS